MTGQKNTCGLNVFIGYLHSYSSHKRIWSVTVSLLITGLLIYVNYFAPHLLHGSSKSNPASFILKFTSYYLLYLLPFAFAFGIQSAFKKSTYFSNKWFLFLLLFAPAIFALRTSVDYNFLQFKQEPGWQYWQICLKWLARVLLLLIPVYFIWQIKDKDSTSFYGNRAVVPLKPYFILLLFMIPFIGMASMQPSFLEIYPCAKVIESLHVPQQYFYLFVYELCYGFDLLGIEFFFRGFLIHAFVKYCGKDCILPAACFYCIVHFNKPMAEAISSFFGGMLLGIISYNTRSVWGGFTLHLGIAWLMEIGGFIAR